MSANDTETHATLKARIAELEEALRPFADFASRADDPKYHGINYGDTTPLRLVGDASSQYGKSPTLADCRKAKAVLERKT